MSIRAIINALLGSLAVVAMLAVAVIAVDSVRRWQGAERAGLQGQVSELLLRASGHWAAERGLTAGAVAAESVATAAQFGTIEEQRRGGDTAMAEVAALIPALDFAVRDELTRQLEARQQRLAALRRQVDAALALDKDGRPQTLATDWFTASSAVIESVLTLRLGLIQANSQTPLIAMTEDLRSQLAVMAEFAGRERGYVNGLISAGRAMGGADMAVLGEFRGRLLGAWEFARILGRQEILSQAMTASMSAVEADYFNRFEHLRAAVYGEGLAGDAYGIDAGDWFAAASEAIATIGAAQQAASHLAAMVTAAQQAQAARILIVAAAAAAIALGLCLIGLVVTQRRVIGPVRGMERTMTRLSGGDLEAEVVGDKRADEIGAMARALRVFRDSMREAAVLRSQQEQAQERLITERRAALLGMADTLEDRVQGIVGEVVSAATQLNSHSLSLSALARQAREQTRAAAQASDTASTNVQTVAAAAEQLAASIAEISRQVADSAGFSQAAVGELAHTNTSMESLLEAVGRVGEVTTLISQIANQTNLLALNATIEAARAGEAGKGFAVVAGEVKALANQTARATEEIAQQIGAIQATTSAAAGAIDQVGDTIRRIHETATAISVAVEQQGAATDEIARAVAQAASGSHLVGDNIGGLSHAAAETNSQAGHVHGAAGQLATQAERLRSALGHFLGGLRAA